MMNLSNHWMNVVTRIIIITRIALLESVKALVRKRFVHVGARYNVGFRWREIDTAFESILTDAVINSKHIELRQFLEDASEILLDRVQDV